MLKRAVWLVLLLASACIGVPTPDMNNRLPPTQPPPLWVEPAEPITLNNVARVAPLGRLDQPGTPSTIFAYTFSPDSTRMVGLNAEQILLWDLITGDLVVNTSRIGANQVYFSPDKTEIYTLDVDGLFGVFDSDRGVMQTTVKAQEFFNGTQAFYADEGWLALGSLSGEIKVWDMFERRSLVTFRAHELQVVALAFSADGTLLASGGDEDVVRIWDWRERRSLKDITVSGDNIQLVRIAFAPVGTQLAVGTTEEIHLYDTQTGDLQATIDIQTGGVSALMLYSPDGRYLVSSGLEQDPSIWDTATGEQVAALPDVGGERVTASFSPDGTMLLATALDAPVTLWNMEQITASTVARAELPVGSTQILFADWTDDSRLMVFVDATGPIYVWGIPPGAATEEARG